MNRHYHIVWTGMTLADGSNRLEVISVPLDLDGKDAAALLNALAPLQINCGSLSLVWATSEPSLTPVDLKGK